MSNRDKENENGSTEPNKRGASLKGMLANFKRAHKTKASKTLFKAIDLIFDAPQNVCPYITKDNESTIECESDVVYDDNIPTVCALDVYRVKSDEPQPAILLIHGGGFSAGDKKYRRGQSQYFALNGFTVFNVNYGLAPDYLFPEPIRHLVTAANFIYDNAERFGIDSSKIIVCGDSAGGYYSAMLSAFNCSERMSELFKVELKFKIAGALLNCGIYDLDTILKTKYLLDVDDGVFLNFVGLSRADLDKFEYRESCMPLHFLNADFPPAFVIYSDYDLFCKGQGNKLVEELEKNGVYCESYSARHSVSNHCFSLNWRGEDAAVANALSLSFAKRLAKDRIKL